MGHASSVSPDPGAGARDLGRAGPLPDQEDGRPRSAAGPRRARRAPARRQPLGPARRARARQRPADRLLQRGVKPRARSLACAATMIRRVLASLVLCLVLLFAGIYLGGHPSGLPGFLRKPLVGDKDTRVVNEAIDRVNQTYYRQVPKKDLANKAIAGVVASLDDRFSNYFSPVEYQK